MTVLISYLAIADYAFNHEIKVTRCQNGIFIARAMQELKRRTSRGPNMLAIASNPGKSCALQTIATSRTGSE